MRHRIEFVTAIALGLSISLTLFIALDAFTPDLFIIVSCMLFVAMVELTAPDIIEVPWRGKLNWLLGVGLVVSLLFLGRRVAEIVPTQGFLP